MLTFSWDALHAAIDNRDADLALELWNKCPARLQAIAPRLSPVAPPPRLVAAPAAPRERLSPAQQRIRRENDVALAQITLDAIRGTCYHEGGHAVQTWADECRLGGVSADYQARRGISHDYATSPQTVLAILWAGALAATPQQDWNKAGAVEANLSRTDRDQTRSLARAIDPYHPETLDALDAWCSICAQHHAQETIAREWRRVVAVAMRLATHKTLTASEVLDVIKNA
jgi:hypothetical protein